MNASGEPAFVAALLAAARSARCWEPGFRVLKSAESWAFVAKERLTIFADYRGLLLPSDAAIGEVVSLRLPCARENLLPGFFSFVGRAGPLPKGGRFRLYLKLAPEAAPPLVAALLGWEEALGLLFEGRVVNNPQAYGRADSGCLCVHPKSRRGMLSLLSDFGRQNPGWLRDAAAPFARRLSKGLGVVEVPHG